MKDKIEQSSAKGNEGESGDKVSNEGEIDDSGLKKDFGDKNGGDVNNDKDQPQLKPKKE